MFYSKEEFAAIIYEKIDLGDGIYMFNPVQARNEIYLNYRTNSAKMDDKKIYLTSSGKIFTNKKYFYDFPMLISELAKKYETTDINEIMKNYSEEMIDVVLFSIYDENTNKIKSVFANKNSIKKAEMDGWYYLFGKTQTEEDASMLNTDDSYNSNCILIPLETVQKLKKAYEENDTRKIRCFLNDLVKEEEVLQNKSTILKTDLDDAREIDLDEAIEKVKPLLDELDGLVGIYNVKEDINDLVKNLIFINKTKEYLNNETPNLSMLFTGNPGTGKTTVARIVAKILYELGYAKSDSFVEVTRKDLVGGYVGHTESKTSDIINKNKGGVIFIDEAYALAQGASDNDFGTQALTIILKELETKNTIFIFAGYKKEMKQLIDLNSGLASRIGRYVEFKDYNVEELLKMFINKVNKTSYKITDDAKAEVLSIIEEAIKHENFGNGRFIDNLYSKIVNKHGSRVCYSNDMEELVTITNEDIDQDLVSKILYSEGEKKREIGFQYKK